MDGLSASLDFMGHPLTLRYAVKENNFAPKAVSVNGKPVQFTYEDNKYRQGGAVIPMAVFLALLDLKENIAEIEL